MRAVAKPESALLGGKTVCGGRGRGSTSRFFPARRSPGKLQPSSHHVPMPIAVGSKAPDFSLKSKTADGFKDVKLSDNLGKKQTVVLFFPAAYTGVCTQEMCDQTSGLGEYEKLGAEVIAISVDSPFAQEAWAKANNIKVTLASDLNKTATRAYDVVL